jgi:hypothetical protein
MEMSKKVIFFTVDIVVSGLLITVHVSKVNND